MADLIDRAALMADIESTVVFSGRELRNAEIRGANKVMDRIADAPTVDAVEVVRCSKCVMHDNCYAEDVYKLVRMDLEKTFCCMGSERRADNG